MWAGNVARLREKRNACAYRILVGKPEGKRPLGRRRGRCQNDIKKIYYRNRMGWCGLDSCGLGWVPVEGSCEHGNEPSSTLKY
jgi:hypothetical protein